MAVVVKLIRLSSRTSFRIQPVAKFAVPWKWIQPILLSAVSRYSDLELGTRPRTEPHTNHLYWIENVSTNRGSSDSNNGCALVPHRELRRSPLHCFECVVSRYWRLGSLE